MTSSERLGLATRAFFLAMVLGLALAFRDTEALTWLAALAVTALAALAAGRALDDAERWLFHVESVVVAVVVAAALPGGGLVLPYLIVPCLLTGVAAGVRVVTVVAALEVLALVLGLAVADRVAVLAGLAVTAPWVVAGVGAGVLSHWMTGLRQPPPPRPDEASYESARRLLSQLRIVARRLSSGLDPVSMADQILAAVHARLHDTQSALFVRTEGGVLAPMGYLGWNAKQSIQAEGRLVETCWAEMEPAHGRQPSGLAETRHRTVLPLRSGARMLGIVISESADPPDQSQLSGLMSDLDDQALRLDTALVFDEVRSLATMEERQRLAREIHDGVAQEISAMGYLVDDLSADATSDAQRERLGELRREISRVVSELRLSIFDLRSEISPGAGLGSALSDYVRAVGARSGLTVHLTLDESPTRLRGEVETELLRIAQEAVTNARKHSHADNLWVDVRIRPPFAHITVVDDGAGLGDPRPDSYGLMIMRERAERIGARLEIGSRDGFDDARGTRVAVTVGDESTAL